MSSLMMMFIDQSPSFYINYFTSKTNFNKNQQGKPDIIALQPLNWLIMTSEITNMAPLPRPSTNLWGNQIYISYLYTALTQFAITPEEKF